MTVRFFVAETDGLPSSLSADLFRHALVALMMFSRGFFRKLGPSSSSPLVKGVPNVEPALLLEKGTDETLVDVVVEASICSAAAFALYLAMVPTIRARLKFTGQDGQEMDSGLFAGRRMRRTKMSDVGCD